MIQSPNNQLFTPSMASADVMLPPIAEALSQLPMLVKNMPLLYSNVPPVRTVDSNQFSQTKIGNVENLMKPEIFRTNNQFQTNMSLPYSFNMQMPNASFQQYHPQMTFEYAYQNLLNQAQQVLLHNQIIKPQAQNIQKEVITIDDDEEVPPKIQQKEITMLPQPQFNMNCFQIHPFQCNFLNSPFNPSQTQVYQDYLQNQQQFHAMQMQNHMPQQFHIDQQAYQHSFFDRLQNEKKKLQKKKEEPKTLSESSNTKKIVVPEIEKKIEKPIKQQSRIQKLHKFLSTINQGNSQRYRPYQFSYNDNNYLPTIQDTKYSTLNFNQDNDISDELVCKLCKNELIFIFLFNERIVICEYCYQRKLNPSYEIKRMASNHGIINIGTIHQAKIPELNNINQKRKELIKSCNQIKETRVWNGTSHYDKYDQIFEKVQKLEGTTEYDCVTVLEDNRNEIEALFEGIQNGKIEICLQSSVNRSRKRVNRQIKYPNVTVVKVNS